MTKIVAKIERETEKALLVKTRIGVSGVTTFVTTFWAPKSQTKVEGDTVEMPGWLASKKLADIKDGRNGDFYFDLLAA